MSVECNMTKANTMTHKTFCSGSNVLKGSSVCQTNAREIEGTVSYFTSLVFLLFFTFDIFSFISNNEELTENTSEPRELQRRFLH